MIVDPGQPGLMKTGLPLMVIMPTITKTSSICGMMTMVITPTMTKRRMNTMLTTGIGSMLTMVLITTTSLICTTGMVKTGMMYMERTGESTKLTGMNTMVKATMSITKNKKLMLYTMLLMTIGTRTTDHPEKETLMITGVTTRNMEPSINMVTMTTTMITMVRATTKTTSQTSLTELSMMLMIPTRTNTTNMKGIT